MWKKLNFHVSPEIVSFTALTDFFQSAEMGSVGIWKNGRMEKWTSKILRETQLKSTLECQRKRWKLEIARWRAHLTFRVRNHVL